MRGIVDELEATGDVELLSEALSKDTQKTRTVLCTLLLLPFGHKYVSDVISQEVRREGPSS